MKPLTFLAALVAALQLCTSSALGSGDWTWPVRGPVITPYKNGSDPYAAGQHRGIDIGARVGDPVVAAVAGRVTFAGLAGSSGLTVSIRTADGRYDTSYLHLSSISVHAGQAVSAGDRIGAVGTTGRRSAEQPHLHFGVREAGSRQAYHDPLDFLAPPPSARPEPAPPRLAPVPIADRVPIPVPAPLLASAPARVPLVAPTSPAPRLRMPGVGLPSPAGSHPLGRPVATGHPIAHAAPVPRRVSRHVPPTPRPSRHPARAGTTPVHLGPAPASAATRRAALGRAATARHSVAPRSHHNGGIDLGWLAACLGLVAASCALGRPALAGREAFAALLRPLSGRG